MVSVVPRVFPYLRSSQTIDLAMVDAEISRLRTLEAERQKARDKKLKGDSLIILPSSQGLC